MPVEEIKYALSKACDTHNLDDIRNLLNHARLHYPDAAAEILKNVDPWLSMVSAAGSGNIDFVEFMLSYDVGTEHTRCIALKRAAENNHWKVVNQLLNHNAKDKEIFLEALILAHENGQMAIVDKIFACTKSDPQFEDMKKIFLNRQLAKACKNNKVKKVKTLLDQGADFSESNIEDAWLLMSKHLQKGHHEMAQIMADLTISSKVERAFTLKAAVSAKQYDLAQQILGQGVYTDGDSILETIEELIKNKGPETLIAGIISHTDQNGDTDTLSKILSMACKAENIKLIKRCFDHNITFEKRLFSNNPGEFLSLALKNNNVALFDLLLSRGDIAPNYLGEALETCFDIQKPQFIKPLLELGANKENITARIVAQYFHKKLPAKLSHYYNEMEGALKETETGQRELQTQLNIALHNACDKLDEPLALALFDRGAHVVNRSSYIRDDYDTIFGKACMANKADLALLISKNLSISSFEIKYAFRYAMAHWGKNQSDPQFKIALNILEHHTNLLTSKIIAETYISLFLNNEDDPHLSLIKHALSTVAPDTEAEIKKAATNALITAGEHGELNTLDTLLKLGADVNGLDHQQKSALQMCLKENQYHCANFLLQNGALPDHDSFFMSLIETDATWLQKLAKKDKNKLIEQNGADFLRKAMIWAEAPSVETLVEYGALTKCSLRELEHITEMAERDKKFNENSFIIQAIYDHRMPFIARHNFNSVFNHYSYSSTKDKETNLANINTLFKATRSSPKTFLNKSDHAQYKTCLARLKQARGR